MERDDIQVSEEEITIQRQFIEEVKEMNYQKEIKSGKKRFFHLVTFGCQMNVHDSEKLAGMLLNMGYIETDNIEESNLVIFNTCCVRENAELKFYGHLGKLKELKKDNPDLIIAVCGCMMQQEEIIKKIKKSYRQVDLVFGTHNLYKFPELTYGILRNGDRIIDVWDSIGQIVEDLPVERKDGVKAWVTIMYGCNNFCTYCIVPYVRGRERSRAMEDIVKEVKILGDEGFKEVTLLGQNVNSYGTDLQGDISFAKLLYELNKVNGIERIRFMTSHPKDLSDELIYAMRDCKKVCKHIHLPFQAGSTKILKDMNRKYSKEDYLALVTKIRENIPGIPLTTDVIVGFPGEKEEDFEDTLDLLKKIRFDLVYSFLYSKRTGTPAAKMAGQVPEELKKERFQRLVEVQNNISREINDTYLDKDVEVLVEGMSKNNDKIFTGRTEGSKIINFEGNKDMIGEIIKVRIKSIKTWNLYGEKL